MTHYQITFHYEGQPIRLEAGGDSSLLELMDSLALPVRRACRNGSCGICRCRLEAGQISYQQRAPFGLREEHINQGFILPCIAYPISDVTLSTFMLDAAQASAHGAEPLF